MAVKKRLSILFFFFVFSFTSSSKLNVPRILLPIFTEISANFTLEVTDSGCYKWSTSRKDLIQLIPINYDEIRDCSASVVVSSISREPVRNTAMVLAQEIQSELLLRCDVILDVISKLNIITTTRELYMEEAPEAFEVRAYDDQGNEFSSLEGIPLQWTLNVQCPETGKCPGNVLRFITFRDSPYETPHAIQQFEDQGLQGHIVLIEGAKTGIAKVSVKLPQSEYKQLESCEVPLMVVANIIIFPPELNILPNGDAKFSVYRMHQNKFEVIEMPNKQYYFVVDDDSIGTVEQNGDVTGLQIGRTRVVINDRNVDPLDSSVKLPSALLVVVMPAYLTINILPFKNWAIMVRDSHEMVVEAFSSQDHKILLSDSVEIDITIEKYFQIIDRSKNGTWIKGYGNEAGFSPVQATLRAVNGKVFDNRVSVRADLFIYPRIGLSPPEINLPWDPLVRPEYEEHLRATGGDGHFLWSTSNAEIAVVTQGGVVRTKSFGEVDVTAAMARNHNNRKSTKIHILPPGRLQIIEYVMEAETDKPIILQIALYGKRCPTCKNEVPFTQCDAIPFEIQLSDENFYYNYTKSGEVVGVACTTMTVVGRAVGTSKVTVTYESQGVVLEDSVTVSTYKPLSLSFDKKGETVLAVGTSRNFIAQGGPRSWGGQLTEHKRTIQSSEPHIVEVIDITNQLSNKNNQCSQDTYVIQVRCLTLGESLVDITVTNKPAPTSTCIGSTSTVTIHVFCSKPRDIRLKPEVEIVDLQSCPMDLNSQKIAVHNYEKIPLSIVVRDDQGRVFDNITTLEFTWKLQPETLANVIFDNFREETNVEFGIKLPKRFMQEIEPKRQNGNLEIIAKVESYVKLFEQGLKVPCVKDTCPQLFTALSFFLVGDVEVVTDTIIMYNHPRNIQLLDLKQGSGYYEIDLSSKDIAFVKYKEASRELEISPKATGELIISVTDICLSSKPTTITVNVVSVKSIKVEMSDKVEIGKCIKAVVKLYDDADVLLPLPDLELLELRTSTESNIILVKQTCEGPCPENEQWGTGEIHYIITGLELGETKLSFATGHGAREARSNPITVQVFKPIKVLPRNVTLIVSSVLQLTHEGGPSDANIQFTVSNAKIGSIESNGLIEAKQVGTTQILVQATGINPGNGQRVLYSKDSVQLNVVKLAGIKIGAPLSRFQVGKTVPVWALGVPEQLTPLILGTTKLPISYEWQVIPDEVARVCTVFGCSGVKYSNKQQVAIHLKGLVPGRAKLQLNVTVDRSISGPGGGYGDGPAKFTATLDIEVFEPLIISPPTDFKNQKILLTPYSTFQITTNKDRTGHLAYAVQQDTQTALIGDENSLGFAKSVITVSQSGLVRSFGVYGLAVVLVTSVEDFGLKQTHIIFIEVKPVHYMLTQVHTKINIAKEQSVSVMPRGVDLEMKVTYHDNTGDEFVSARNDLRIRVSRFDLVKIRRGNNNETLYAHLHKSGDTMLKIWDDAHPMRVVEYIKFHVGDIIKPSSPKVTSGDVVCFSSPLLSNSGQPGSWDSGYPFVQGGELDGVMVAVRPRDRPTTVSYVVSPDLQTTTDVQILPVERIRFLTENTCGCVSNSFRLSVEEIPLVLLSKYDGPEKINNLISYGKCNPLASNQIKNFPFSCEIDFLNTYLPVDIADIFAVEPNFNFKTGQYSCKILTVNTPDVNTSLLSSNITLKVTAGAIKAEQKLNFVPGVFIDNSDLAISQGRYKGYVNIHGIPEVLSKLTVNPVDAEYLQVYPSSVISDTCRRFEVWLRKSNWKGNEDKMVIVVESKLTKQNLQIEVKTDYDGAEIIDADHLEWGSPLMATLWNFRQVFAIGASLLGVFLASIYGYSNYIQPVINGYVQSQRPLTPEQMLNTTPPRNKPLNYSGGIVHTCGAYGASPSRLTARSDCSCYGTQSTGFSPRRTGFSPPNTFNNTAGCSPNGSVTYEEIRNRYLNK